MKPFILIEVEDNCVADTTVVGDVQIEPIVIDWDLIDCDEIAAGELIDEILAHFDNNDMPEAARVVVQRLQDIIDEATLDEEEDDEDMDEDDEDLMDEDLDDEDDEDEDDEADEEADDRAEVRTGNDESVLDPRD